MNNDLNDLLEKQKELFKKLNSFDKIKKNIEDNIEELQNDIGIKEDELDDIECEIDELESIIENLEYDITISKNVDLFTNKIVKDSHDNYAYVISCEDNEEFFIAEFSNDMEDYYSVNFDYISVEYIVDNYEIIYDKKEFYLKVKKTLDLLSRLSVKEDRRKKLEKLQ